MTKETQHTILVYMEVQRKIDFYYKLQKITTYHELTVTPTAVISAKAEYALNTVLDVSYKPFSSQAGILYLHTNQGVFAFYIQSSPQKFIDTFRSFKIG
ncbi:hypothetical protein [Paenisporosarcina sp. TG-14]|uniref:hypothetical protein n=1 Tax=Paenisporosarcina sp. TG-14 TaxID=1231057 RepID=UPI0002DE08AB|nr:hypothetical protein [Paenisporosarcina sp. TG-14]